MYQVKLLVTCFSCFCFFCNVAVTFKFSRPVFPEHPFTNPSSGKFVMDKSFRLLSNHWKTSHYHLLLHHHFDKRGLISRFPPKSLLDWDDLSFFWAGTLLLWIFSLFSFCCGSNFRKVGNIDGYAYFGVKTTNCVCVKWILLSELTTADNKIDGNVNKTTWQA